MSFGNSLNSSVSAPVDAMLTVVINSSYGASAFIARLIPVRNLTVEFLHVANSVHEVIHSAGSHVFSLMCEDLSVNEKTYNIFHETFDSFRCYIDCTSLQKHEV